MRIPSGPRNRVSSMTREGRGVRSGVSRAIINLYQAIADGGAHASAPEKSGDEKYDRFRVDT